jgi:hypothetical protein
MSRYLEDDDFIEQEKFRIARERVVAAQTPTAFENLDEEQKRVRLAGDYARDVALAAKPAIPTSFNPAAFRIAEEKSMGADIPPGVTPQYPFEPVVEIPSDDPDDDPDDEPDDEPDDDEPTVYPKAGTILRYKPGRAGYRIPVIADGKGGEYDGDEVKDPDYDPGDGPGDGSFEFIEYVFNADFTKRRAKFFNKKTSKFSYGEWEPNPQTKDAFDAEQAKIIAAETELNKKRDAFALIDATMQSYGFNAEELKELGTYIQAGLLNPKLGPEQLILQLRQLPVYKARFAGNEERRARGLNALSEANYLIQERAYAETFRQYGLQRFNTRGQFATFIGNEISNTEVGKRVKTAVERLQMGDPAILRQLRNYYGITDSDIVSYFLNPKEVLPELEAKTTTAEIGATAGQFGLNTDLARVSDLERYGVTLDRARKGYSNIAPAVKEGKVISDIFKETGIDYNQTLAEQEEFKGLASARRARERLSGLQAAAFGKDAALTTGSLSARRSGAY